MTRPPLLVLAGLLACALPIAARAGAGPLGPFALGDFQVTVYSEPVRFEVRVGGQGEPLLESRASVPSLEFLRGEARVKSRFGSYHFEQDIQERAVAWAARLASRSESAIELIAELAPVPPAHGPRERTATLRLSVAAEGALEIAVAARAEDSLNRIRFSYPAPSGEDYLGFGEQYNRVRHAGRQVPIWVAEQGIGRGDGPFRLPFTGNTTDSYFPLPFFLSTRGYGLLAESPARAVFDLKTPPRADRVTAEVWSGTATFHLLLGPRPADVVRRLTRRTGRPRMLPDWGFGVWVACQGGPARLTQLIERLRGAGAAPDAIWAQDWLGARKRWYGYDVRYHWTADETLYPDLKGFIAGLHAQGVKFLGYFNSFIEPEFPEFQEAAAKGYLVRKADGKPYVQRISTFDGGLVDLSNPAARNYLSGYLRRAMQLGIDGWMADFGEWLPWDSRVHASEGPALWHNRYPVEWARLNREACLAERPGGDFVIFSRAGHLGSVPVTDMVWAGDQNTSWGKDDGLPSVVPAGLNLGLSGVPFYHFDAGGFTSLVSLPRGQELFMRWVEAGAMSPLLRTHEGYWRDRNIQPDSNVKVLAHFAKMAALHRRIQPKLIAAAREAVETGMPIVRHLWLCYPEDPATLGVEDQYQLGPDLMAAPVLRPGAKSRRVYFPAGSSWRHVTTGEGYRGPGWADVAAPLGEPPLFVREGAALPAAASR